MLVACAKPCTYRPLSRVSRGSPPRSSRRPQCSNSTSSSESCTISAVCSAIWTLCSHLGDCNCCKSTHDTKDVFAWSYLIYLWTVTVVCQWSKMSIYDCAFYIHHYSSIFWRMQRVQILSDAVCMFTRDFGIAWYGSSKLKRLVGRRSRTFQSECVLASLA